mmetsp:Transcript_31707/g.71309  ORF Transcript_31707/g.71309 Transcript_31707/m.71309 type:complete len:85 (-) Transcript_31707:260-514(-)
MNSLKANLSSPLPFPLSFQSKINKLRCFDQSVNFMYTIENLYFASLHDFTSKEIFVKYHKDLMKVEDKIKLAYISEVLIQNFNK